MILSHHVIIFTRSPKRPKTIEALMLYYLDDWMLRLTASNRLWAKAVMVNPMERVSQVVERFLLKRRTRQLNLRRKKALVKKRG